MHCFYNDVYFFFNTVKRISTRRSAPIFTNSAFSFRKLQLVGTFRRSFFDFLNSFRARSEKLPKNFEKSLKTGRCILTWNERTDGPSDAIRILKTELNST